MQEKHEFGLVVASNKLEAKNIAKSKWLIGYKKKHKDDIACLKKLINCDDCQLIKKIGNWEIELIPENNLEIDNHSPDWYGYIKNRYDLIYFVAYLSSNNNVDNFINCVYFSFYRRLKRT